jgi:hypothetical protein
MTTRKTGATCPYNAQQPIVFQVCRMFIEDCPPHGTIATNPVTGSLWVSGRDPIETQMEAAHRALRAREWFAVIAPPDAPPLPLSRVERAELKRGGLPHLVAWYAESLAARDYEYREHPSFEDYARGVLASPYAHDIIKEDAQLRERFPPTPLDGLGPGRIWVPAKPNSWKCARFSRRQRDGLS